MEIKNILTLNSILGVTFDLSLYWHQYPWTLGEIVCRLRAWISEMWADNIISENYSNLCHVRTFYVSVLTIFCFSWERYLAICHPIYLYTMAGTARTTRWVYTKFKVKSWMFDLLFKALFMAEVWGWPPHYQKESIKVFSVSTQRATSTVITTTPQRFDWDLRKYIYIIISISLLLNINIFPVLCCFWIATIKSKQRRNTYHNHNGKSIGYEFRNI